MMSSKSTDSTKKYQRRHNDISFLLVIFFNHFTDYQGTNLGSVRFIFFH